MATTTYLNMLEETPLIAISDVSPWGGYSNVQLLDGSRVVSVDVNANSQIDSATISFPLLNLGQEKDFFSPVKIIAIQGVGENAVVTTLFRGFVTVNEGEISSDGERVRVQCKDWKWLLSRRTTIRGRWYASEEYNPVSLGSGISEGDVKVWFEKFRSTIGSGYGYLQNKECIFNQYGIPDCKVDNQINRTDCVFYTDKIDWNEAKGRRNSYWQSRNWNGFYWSWASILSHIDRYWIEPYNSILAGIRISEEDLISVKAIDKDYRYPMDYSIESSNPMEAVDRVVKSLPGRWAWYLDYNSANNVLIRIKQIKDNPVETVSLRIAEEGTKLINSDANVEKLNYQRDGSDGAKYVIARGGSVKLVTTVKLVPLWPKYGPNKEYDFKSESDFIQYRRYITEVLGEKSKNENRVITIPREDLLRYSKIYRQYGVALEGTTFTNTLRSVSGDVLSDIRLDGEIGSDYAGYTVKLKEMFFKKSYVKRTISAPMFGRYGDQIVIFARDLYAGHTIIDIDEEEITRDIRLENDLPELDTEEPTEENIEDSAEDSRFVTTENDLSDNKPDSFEYDIDEENMIVTFKLPQFARHSEYEFVDSTNVSIINSIHRYTWDGGVPSGGYDQDSTSQSESSVSDGPEQDSVAEEYDNSVGDAFSATAKMISRDIYMTATFTTDVAAIIHRKTAPQDLIDRYSGADFSTYIENGESEIIVHENAWYPITDENRDEELIEAIGDLFDGEPVARTLRKCDKFDNYSKYIGSGYDDLVRIAKDFVENYNRYEETLNATLPYLEIGYSIGDVLRKVHGTSLDDLMCYLMKINWNNVEDTEFYQTELSFSNNIDKSPDTVTRSREGENENMMGKRVVWKYVNRDLS